jgi:hypothetical protein
MPDTAAPPVDLAAMFASLADGDDSDIRAYLQALGINPGSVSQLPRWTAAVNVIPRPRIESEVDPAPTENDSAPTEKPADRVATLRTLLTVVASRPLGAATLGVFTHFVCEQEWEISYHYGPIRDTLQALRTLWPDHRHLASSPSDAEAMDVVVQLLELLEHELDVETELTTGEIDHFRTSADHAHRSAVAIVKSATGIGSINPELAGYLRAHGRTRLRYYELVLVAAVAADDYLAGRAQRRHLAIAIAKLREGEYDDVLAHNDKSEVRAHRFSLEAMHDRADEQWLRVEHGKISYIYPFGLREFSPGDPPHTDATAVVDRVRAEAADWQLAGVAVEFVEAELPLDSAWTAKPLNLRTGHVPPERGTKLAGSVIRLPHVILRIHGREVARLRAEIIVSDLGNHHVIFDGDLVDASPQEVHFALFRAAPEHGAISVSFAGADRVWPRLCELAASLMTSMYDQFSGSGKQVALSAQGGMYHVVLSVNAASTTSGPASRDRLPISSAADAVAAMGGGTLMTSISSSVGALAEWVRLGTNADAIVPGLGFAGDIVARTANTTVFVMPGTPDWAVETYRSIAIFVASLDGLATAWFDELATQLAHIRRIIEDIDRSETPRASVVRAYSDQLRREQVQLQSFVAEARSLQSLIGSPALLEAPLVAEILRKLLNAAGFARVEANFADRARELLDDRLGARLVEITEHQERRRRTALEIVLALVTAAGVSGLVQVYEGGVSEQWSRVQSGVVAAVVLLVAVLLVASAYVVGGWRRRR